MWISLNRYIPITWSVFATFQFPNWHSKRCLCAIQLLLSQWIAYVLVGMHSVVRSCPQWQNRTFILLGLHERCKTWEGLARCMISVLAFIRCDRWQGALHSPKSKLLFCFLFSSIQLGIWTWCFSIYTLFIVIMSVCVGRCGWVCTFLRWSLWTLHKISLELNMSAELHIFWILPSSHFLSLSTLRVIQGSGLVLGWLSNKQAYRKTGAVSLTDLLSVLGSLSTYWLNTCGPWF